MATHPRSRRPPARPSIHLPHHAPRPRRLHQCPGCVPEVLTTREAAAILRVGRNQLYQAIARGELSAVRIGRSIRIPKQALLDLLAPASPRPSSDNE